MGRVDQVVPNDGNNFAPRMGFSWDPFSNGRLAVRGGYGIAYERLFNNSITNIRFNPPYYAFTSATPVTTPSHAGLPIAYGPINPDGRPRNEPITITGPNNNIGVQPGLGIEGNIIGWNPRFGTTTQSLRVPDPNTKDAFTHAWFVGTQTEIGGNVVLEANYIGNVGRNYGRLVDYNTVRGDLFDGRLDRLNPTFGGINYRAMLARSEYHGLQLQVNKRYARGWSGQVSYTLGKAMDDGSDVQVGGAAGRRARARARVGPVGLRRAPPPRDQLAVGDPVLPRARRAGGRAAGRVADQRRHGAPERVPLQRVPRVSATPPAATTTAMASTTTGRTCRRSGWTLPDTSQEAYRNGLFVAADFPRPDAARHAAAQRLLGTGVHQHRSLALQGLQAAVPGARIQVRVEAFNLFNRVNLQRPNGNMAQATFGRSTQSFAAREIQLAIKLIF